MTGFDEYQWSEFADPNAIREAMDNEPNLSPGERRRGLKFASDWDADLARENAEHLNKRSESITKEVNLLIEDAAAELRIVAQAPQDPRAKKITVEEALKILAKGTREHDSFVKRKQSITEYVERWNEDADADPVEKLHRDQQRFSRGNPRHGRRALTVKMLRGES